MLQRRFLLRTELTMARRDQKPDLASAMYPALSRETKAREAWQVRAEAERKARLKRTADNLQATIDAVLRDREQQGRP
jgi:hypothetical protein